MLTFSVCSSSRLRRKSNHSPRTPPHWRHSLAPTHTQNNPGSPKSVFCPHCSKSLGPSTFFCQRCSTSLLFEWQCSCPRCGSGYSQHGFTCLNCRGPVLTALRVDHNKNINSLTYNLNLACVNGCGCLPMPSCGSCVEPDSVGARPVRIPKSRLQCQIRLVPWYLIPIAALVECISFAIVYCFWYRRYFPWRFGGTMLTYQWPEYFLPIWAFLTSYTLGLFPLIVYFIDIPWHIVLAAIGLNSHDSFPLLLAVGPLAFLFPLVGIYLRFADLAPRLHFYSCTIFPFLVRFERRRTIWNHFTVGSTTQIVSPVGIESPHMIVYCRLHVIYSVFRRLSLLPINIVFRLLSSPRFKPSNHSRSHSHPNRVPIHPELFGDGLEGPNLDGRSYQPPQDFNFDE